LSAEMALALSQRAWCRTTAWPPWVDLCVFASLRLCVRDSPRGISVSQHSRSAIDLARRSSFLERNAGVSGVAGVTILELRSKPLW